jgi:AAA15 family ATPase/GTPase
MQEKENHFIKNIEIKNFKCFEDFKAEGFGRVNLIGGKNNVGKTAFMEACYLNSQKNTSYAVANIIFDRYQIDFLSKLIKEMGTKYIFNFISGEAKKFSITTISSNLGKKTISYQEKDSLDNSLLDAGIEFFGSIKAGNSDLDDWYSKIIENKLENAIDESLRNFDNSLESFRMIKSEPKCSKITDGKFYNLNEFGDGLAKFIALNCLLISLDDGGIIFIDEIENGIHYTNLDKLWEIILTISKQQNVQVFATTHSKECIESYARVAKKLEDEEITFIELGKNDENEITSIVYEYDDILNQVAQHQDIRGW